MVKSLLRRIIPGPLLAVYHLALARLAAAWYGHPSEQLLVIGVTGTNGKSTTTQFIGQALEHLGHRVGWTTTVSFKVAGREWVNDQKMTMLGRFQTQKLLREMVDAGCTHAVIETSSQGIAQFRHVGINYDLVVFTNLTPEHIEAHGGFENYKKAKGKLFAHLAGSPRKTVSGLHVDKTAVVNIDDPHVPYFLSFRTDRQYGFGFDPDHAKDVTAAYPVLVPIVGERLEVTRVCSTFRLRGVEMHVHPIGAFHAANALAAAATLRALGIEWKAIGDAVDHLRAVPGRLERIEEGQPFTVIVDYAYEPAALNAVYAAISLLPRKRLIHILGSAGGGRDVSRRAVLGQMAAERDDVVIVTNEDPYDEDPQTIIDQVADAAAREGKRENVDLFRILDRAEAIQQAMHLAAPDDLVLITGKGSEPVMAVADGKKIPWDDRSAAREALHQL